MSVFNLFNLSIANWMGFLALLLYVATLLPTLIRILFVQFRRNQITLFLTKYRRQIGILAWLAGLVHGTILVYERNLNLLDPSVAIHYFQGISMMTIFTLLAITSNDWSVKKLKQNWKKLHYLTYLVLFLLPWHILDKMQLHWSYLTFISLVVVLVVAVFSIQRWRLEKRKKEGRG